MGLKIGQINAQRSAAAAANLELLFAEKNLDILCLQEPYYFKKQVRGYAAKSLRKVQPESCDYSWVAAVVRESRVEILQGLGDQDEHVMCFKVITEATEFYIINAYCQCSLPLEPILKKIEKILGIIKSNDVILTMDANSKSLTWFSGETDERGRILEEFLMSNNLYILNRPSEVSTFCRVNAESNIDITIAGDTMVNRIKNWRVDSSCTTSDHNLILFELEEGLNSRKFLKKEKSYNIKKADWTKFYEELNNEFNDERIKQLETLTPDTAIKKFNKLLELCCSRTIPKIKSGQNLVPWWSEELSELRKNANRAKRQYMRAKRLGFEELLEVYGEKYKRERNKYVADIRKRKRYTWENFVTTEGNREPWSIVYKIIREKLNKSTYLNSLILNDGTRTSDLNSTVKELLKKCVPMEDQMDDCDEHREIRQKIQTYKNYNLEDEITPYEISSAIKRFKKNKAPGIDGFSIEIIKKLWGERPIVLYKLFNNCFNKEVFPKEWKIADLKIILKDHDRDKSLVNSYRPIALLSVLGKVYERIIVERIEVAYKQRGLSSDRQYGFKKGVGTEDAFINLKRAIRGSERKYIVIMFVDVEGAFDNLWWPAILNRMLAAECSTKLVNVIKSYFKNRRVRICTKLGKTEVKMRKGCPQGSIIGPSAWLWCMDAFLRKVEENIPEEDVEVIAYADDLACVVKGNSRAQVECNIEKLLVYLNNWCKLHKLNISVDKTFAMLVKGKFDRERMPVIKINNRKIKYVMKVKYLGLIIDEKLKFIEHAKYIRSKVIKFVMAIRRISREKWGLRINILKIMYKAVALPIIKYGSTMWYDQTQNSLVKRHLMATQRALLLLITRACRTTSTVALQVIAGVKPLDLEIIEQAVSIRVRRNISTNVANINYVYREREVEEFKRIVSGEMNNIRKATVQEWQKRWNEETRGRITYEFIKQVMFTQNNLWFRPGRLCVYMITGYGPINASLYRRGSVVESSCPMCGSEEETVNHLIYECSEYQIFRYTELGNVERSKEELINTEDRFKKFQNFVIEIFERRKQNLNLNLRRIESRGSASSGQGR